MSDVKAWIEERREIHRGGWNGKWSWSLNDTDLATLRATGGHVDFDLIRDDEFRGPSEVLDEIVDAHNVTVPRALSALDSVLELHVPKTRYGLDYYSGQYPCVECNMSDQEGLNPTPWPCPTVQAIEGAIND